VKQPVGTIQPGERPAVFFFWATACFLLLWALGVRAIWGPEGRWAEITREMMATRDFFHPAQNGNPYFDKPLLSYWFITFTSILFGRLNEWTLRIPSALSALAGLWATIDIGRRLWSERVGRMAGWLLLTTYGVLFWGRVGTAEMENLAAAVLAVAWYWRRRKHLNFFTFLVFYLICFSGANTKGLAALIIPALAVFPDMIRNRRLKHLVKPPHLLALIIGITVYLAPFLYADATRHGYGESGLFLVFRENFQRYFSPFDHVKPFYVYLYYLPLFFLPWTPMFLTALFGVFPSIRDLGSSSRWLLEASLLIFLFFSGSGSRRSYYILPLLPYCALGTAVFFHSEGRESLKRFGLSLQEGLLILLAVIEVASPLLGHMIRAHTGFVPSRELVWMTFGIGVITLLFRFFGRRASAFFSILTGTAPRVAVPVLMASVLMGGFFCGQQVVLEGYRTERPFVQALKKRISGPPRKEIAFYKVVSPKILFYLDHSGPVRVLPDTAAVLSYLRSGPGEKILVARRTYLPELSPLLPAGVGEHPALSERTLSDRWASEKKPGNLIAWVLP